MSAVIPGHSVTEALIVEALAAPAGSAERRRLVHEWVSAEGAELFRRWARNIRSGAEAEDAAQDGAVAVIETLLKLAGPEAIRSSPGGFVRATFVRGAWAAARRFSGAPAASRKAARLRRVCEELTHTLLRAPTAAELLTAVEREIIERSSGQSGDAAVLRKQGYRLADAAAVVRAMAA